MIPPQKGKPWTTSLNFDLFIATFYRFREEAVAALLRVRDRLVLEVTSRVYHAAGNCDLAWIGRSIGIRVGAQPSDRPVSEARFVTD